MIKAIHDRKVEIESPKKTQTEVKLEMKTLGSQIKSSGLRFINTGDGEKESQTSKIGLKKKNTSVKEYVKS